MSKVATSEERKARRAEINRENAKKSTGPKSVAGKMVVRLNGLKHGGRSSVIDLSAVESLELLPSEGPKDYQRVVANFADKIQPRDEVELGISQRLADLQWRLLRLQRNERIFNEECLDHASQMAHVGASQDRLGDLDSMNGFRVGVEAKMGKEFRREELAILRARAMTYRELEMVRKLDPLPKSPLTRRAQVLGPSQAASALETRNPPPDQKIQPDDLMEETVPTPNNQTQPPVAWNFAAVPLPRRRIEQAEKAMAAGRLEPVTRAMAAGDPLDFS